MDPGRLDSSAIVGTAERLVLRIDDRFALSGLSRVGHHLAEVARLSQARVERLRRPRWPLRVVVVGSIGVLSAVAVFAAASVEFDAGDVRGFAQWIQVVESAMQSLVFVGLAGVFLFGIEGRRRRREMLAALHELRSLAHVIDMHQLTKDPEALLSPELRTDHSPARTMTPFELTRYLDYCSEMLSLTAKLAAMYAQESEDPVVLDAVREIQDLGSGMSGEIWQKMILLRESADQGRLVR